MMNIREINKREPVFRQGGVRRNADGDIDWNNLITTAGNSISSVFGWLTSKNVSTINAQQQEQQSRNSNTVLWIGIGVVVVIVVGLIVFLRKK